MPNSRTEAADCIQCGATYRQEIEDWLYIDGEPVSGYGGDGKGYYTVNGDTVTEETPGAEIRTQRIYGFSGPRDCCPECTDRFWRNRERDAELAADVPPAWFDEADAGEVWDDEY